MIVFQFGVSLNFCLANSQGVIEPPLEVMARYVLITALQGYIHFWGGGGGSKGILSKEWTIIIYILAEIALFTQLGKRLLRSHRLIALLSTLTITVHGSIGITILSRGLYPLWFLCDTELKVDTPGWRNNKNAHIRVWSRRACDCGMDLDRTIHYCWYACTW